MRLGLLGGTFDPIHTGHLLAAEVARHTLGLERVVFVPAGDPPHKSEQVTAAEHRYVMALMATAAHEAFVVSRQEIERSGPSYSLITVQEFRHAMNAEDELFFILGADALLEIRTWYRWEELLRECAFAAVTRPGFDSAALRALLPEPLLSQVHPVASPGLDISSTEIRARVREGLPIRYLVPDAVESYIRKYRLYVD